jgi:hypothetical protein
MMDWLFLFKTSLWILPLAAALGLVGYAVWMAREMDRSFSTMLARPTWQSAFSLIGGLLSLGQAISNPVLWVSLIWGLLGLGCIVWFVREYRRLKR